MYIEELGQALRDGYTSDSCIRAIALGPKRLTDREKGDLQRGASYLADAEQGMNNPDGHLDARSAERARRRFHTSATFLSLHRKRMIAWSATESGDELIDDKLSLYQQTLERYINGEELTPEDQDLLSEIRAFFGEIGHINLEEANLVLTNSRTCFPSRIY